MPDHLDDAALDGIEARANAATDGPWDYPYPGKNYITTPVDIDVTEADWGGEGLRRYRLACSDDRNAWRAQDVEFIAHARTDVPALVAALRAEREEVTRLRESNDYLTGRIHHGDQRTDEIMDQRDAAIARAEAAEAAIAAVRADVEWVTTHDGPDGPEWLTPDSDAAYTLGYHDAAARIAEVIARAALDTGATT